MLKREGLRTMPWLGLRARRTVPEEGDLTIREFHPWPSFAACSSRAEHTSSSPFGGNPRTDLVSPPTLVKDMAIGKLTKST